MNAKFESFKIAILRCREFCHKPTDLALGKQNQEHWKFKANLGPQEDNLSQKSKQGKDFSLSQDFQPENE